VPIPIQSQSVLLTLEDGARHLKAPLGRLIGIIAGANRNLFPPLDPFSTPAVAVSAGMLFDEDFPREPIPSRSSIELMRVAGIAVLQANSHPR